MQQRYVLSTLFLLVVTFEQVTAKPMLTHIDVFTSGEDGYHSYRIPAIETAPDGSLIALAEARKYNRSDPGMNDNDIDLVLKRSSDLGKTWSRLTILDDPGEHWSACNPATLVDKSNGRIWVFHCRTRPGRSSITSRPGTDDCQNWAQISEDHGQTWSEPIDLTHVARGIDPWGCTVFGPGGAIQDKKGRLIVPMCKTTGRKNQKGQPIGGPWNPFVIYSENHGRTWNRSQLLPDGDWGNENQLVELANGLILMDLRQDSGPNRWITTSDDGCQTWSVPRTGQSLTRVACAIERYTFKTDGDNHNRILWTGPKGPERSHLVVRVSYDEGRSFPQERTVSTDKAAYSDLTVLHDDTVGVLWERDDYRHITFSRFNLEFLEPKDFKP